MGCHTRNGFNGIERIQHHQAAQYIEDMQGIRANILHGSPRRHRASDNYTIFVWGLTEAHLTVFQLNQIESTMFSPPENPHLSEFGSTNER